MDNAIKEAAIEQAAVEKTTVQGKKPGLLKQRLLSRSVIIKFIGLICLSVYFLNSHFNFDVVWFFMAMMVSIGAFLLYILTVVTFSYYHNGESYNEQQQFVRDKKTWGVYLPGMEDGVFLLPLLFVDINLLSVTIAALLYGLSNYRYLSNLYCVVKMLSYFVVALWVLPYGLWAVVLAHMVVDTLVTYNLSNWLSAEDDESERKLPSL